MKIMPKWPKDTQRHHAPGNKLVAVLAYEGVNAFELGLAVEVFGLVEMGSSWYRVVVCAERPGQPVRANNGIKITADTGLRTLMQAGTIIVPGWHDLEVSPPESLLECLRRAHARGARIASICSGVFVLAAAGLLEGRRAAAHWANADILARKYPGLRVDPNVLYVDEGDIMSSAGRAAGLDLCIHIVRRDFGTEVANRVARRLVTAPHREGGQAQYIARPVSTESDALPGVFAWARRHLDRDLTIATLASKAKMSRRTFIRRFEEATGISPGEWVVQARVARARELLESTQITIENVATETGFGSADTLRHHFRKRLHTSPAHYRFSFRL